MNKIVRKADVKVVLNNLVKTEEPLILWSNIDSVRYIDTVEKTEDGYRITIFDDVTGAGWRGFFYPSEAINLIWENRKYINESGQLEKL